MQFDSNQTRYLRTVNKKQNKKISENKVDSVWIKRHIKYSCTLWYYAAKNEYNKQELGLADMKYSIQ